jgi:hypothetical protein
MYLMDEKSKESAARQTQEDDAKTMRFEEVKRILS